jgi:hypothetical protein
MMSDVGDNEQPTDPPEQPPVPSPQQPAQPQPDWSQEQLRQFQEFLRFQQFQEFSRQQDQPPAAPPPTAPPLTGPDQPTPPSGLPAIPASTLPAVPATNAPDLHQQLAGVSQQLTELSASQRRVERVVNPPLWKKILRSRPVRWVFALIILAIIGIWGVPALVHYYIGGSDSASSGSNPTRAAVTSLSHDHPFGTIAHIVEGIGPGNGTETCQEYFDAAGQNAFAAAVGADNCADAILKLHPQVTSQDAYENPVFSQDVLQLPQVPGPGQPQTVTISNCSVQYNGGPPLGTFTLRYSAQQQGWLVNGYASPTRCAPPTSTQDLPIPTG